MTFNPNTVAKAGQVVKSVDGSEAYANANNYYIYFTHIPTGLSSEFKAFMTDFNDQFTSNWNDVPVYGRMDPISTFQGTSREISFSFDVVAHDEQEAKINFFESQKLIQSLYPVYQRVGSGTNQTRFSATSIQAPPLIRIKFTNLISGQGEGLVGKLNGLSYQPDFEAGVFEGTGKLKSNIIPKVNRFACVFTVFHTDGVGFDRDGIFRGGGKFPYPDTAGEIIPRAENIPGSGMISSTPVLPTGEAGQFLKSITDAEAEAIGIDRGAKTGLTGQTDPKGQPIRDPGLNDPDQIAEWRETIEELREEGE